MKKLIVVSNHPPSGWSEEHKKGWDEIVYIQFPNVPAHANSREFNKIAERTVLEISLACKNSNRISVCIQGDFSLSVATILAVATWENINFVFPTTERIVEEKDGVKTSVFRFVQWRQI